MQKCKILMRIAIVLTIFLPISIYIFYINPTVREVEEANYNSDLFKVDVLNKTNASQYADSYNYNFEINIANNSSLDINKLTGIITIFNADNERLLIGEVSIPEVVLAGNAGTWDVVLNNRNKELWDTVYDELNIYFRITEINYVNGARIKFNNSDSLIKSAKIYTPGVNAYSVYFDTCGGNSISSKVVRVGGKVKEPIPTRDGYDANDFLGWYVDTQYTEKFDFDTLIYQNKTLYAKWATRYSVVFETFNGNKIDSQLVKTGETIQEIIPTKNGYDFIDWYLEPEFIHKYNFDTQINRDMTLYAKWVDSGLNSEVFDFELNIYYQYRISYYNGTSEEVILPKTHDGKPVTIIGAEAFYNKNITSIVIPNSITQIGYGAFRNCKKLVTVDIPDSVTSIGNSAFYGCSELSEITLSERITSISDSTFYGCTKLTTICIPNSITTIYNNAFTNCQGLTTIIIPNNVETIKSGAFQGCSNLTNINLSSKMTQIYASTFDGCTNLTTIFIPNSITIIDNNAFQNCVNLTSIIFPRNLLSIGNYAFKGCTGLTAIIIPHNVSIIGYSIFDDCTGLNAIYCEAESKPDAWQNTWKGNCSVEPIWGYTGGN